MTKQEFIQEAALRLISARPNTPMGDIADLANALAAYIYKDEAEPSDTVRPTPAVSDTGDFMADTLEDLLREVDKIEAADVEERKKVYGRHCQIAGFGVRLANVFRREWIETVGVLIDTGSREMLRKQDVGPGCISLIKRALENLYNIKTW